MYISSQDSKDVVLEVEGVQSVHFILFFDENVARLEITND
jgi:hypothetical protein